MGLTEPAGRCLMPIIVYLSKAYEVFKEIFLAIEKLLELIRLDLRGLAGEYLTLVGEWRLTSHLGARGKNAAGWAKADHRHGYGCCEVSA
jgi:hypothetical protein